MLVFTCIPSYTMSLQTYYKIISMFSHLFILFFSLTITGTFNEQHKSKKGYTWCLCILPLHVIHRIIEPDM